MNEDDMIKAMRVLRHLMDQPKTRKSSSIGLSDERSSSSIGLSLQTTNPMSVKDVSGFREDDDPTPEDLRHGRDEAFAKMTTDLFPVSTGHPSEQLMVMLKDIGDALAVVMSKIDRATPELLRALEGEDSSEESAEVLEVDEHGGNVVSLESHKARKAKPPTVRLDIVVDVDKASIDFLANIFHIDAQAVGGRAFNTGLIIMLAMVGRR